MRWVGLVCRFCYMRYTDVFFEMCVVRVMLFLLVHRTEGLVLVSMLGCSYLRFLSTLTMYVYMAVCAHTVSRAATV